MSDKEKLEKIEEICKEYAIECNQLEAEMCDEDVPYTGDWDEGRLAGMKNILNSLAKAFKNE